MYTFVFMNYSDMNKPTPVRLKELKAPLQEEAMRIDRSLNWLIVKVLKEYLKELKREKNGESLCTYQPNK